LIVALFAVRVDYFAEWPGRVFDVTSLVTVEDGHGFDADGNVAFPTVSRSSDRLTVFEYLRDRFDDDVELLPADDVLPEGVTVEQSRELNLALMDESKHLAPAVALEHLGYDVITDNGAQVARVVDDSPARGVLNPGDTILAVDGAPVSTSQAAVQALASRKPGDPVHLRLAASDTVPERDVDVILGAHPDTAGRPFLGVELRTRVRFAPFPFKIDLSSGDVGGPSGGLAYTLEIIDVLTPGELTGGHKVAATGEILPDGRVGMIGGVAHKARAVERAGYDVFVVPSSNLAEAKKAVNGKLRVVGVDDVDDALGALASLGGNGLALGQPGKVD
jgi:Lon-like protease